MAVAMYYGWDRAGRPLTPATPVAEVVARFRARFPTAGPFSFFANEDHYQAVPAEDHTPYSQTGWPLASPYPVVFATDIMHQPIKGVDCNELFTYWIAEARAGRMPWLKYMIWRAKFYDVRNGWRSQPSAGHYDHIHLSVRTDHRYTSLGSWALIPPEAPDMTPLQAIQLQNTERYLQALCGLQAAAHKISDTVREFEVPFVPTQRFAEILEKLDDITARLVDLEAPQLPQVDLDAVRHIVREELDNTGLSQR